MPYLSSLPVPDFVIRITSDATPDGKIGTMNTLRFQWINWCSMLFWMAIDICRSVEMCLIGVTSFYIWSQYLWRRFRLPFSWPTIPDHFSTPIFHFRHDCDAALSSSSGLTLMSRALPQRYDTGPLLSSHKLNRPPFLFLSVLLAHCIEKSRHPVTQYKYLTYSVQYSLLCAEKLMQNYKITLATKQLD